MTRGSENARRRRGAMIALGLAAILLAAITGGRSAGTAEVPRKEPSPATLAVPVVRPLDATEQRLFDQGRSLFDMCTQCHGHAGEGVAEQTPPLVGSHIALGPVGRPIRILLHGMDGPLTVAGHEYNNAMPPPLLESDEEVAAVLTYIRRAWGNEATAVSPATVAAIRAATIGRETPWTWEELERVP